jgi:hypothetical protein
MSGRRSGRDSIPGPYGVSRDTSSEQLKAAWKRPVWILGLSSYPKESALGQARSVGRTLLRLALWLPAKVYIG